MKNLKLYVWTETLYDRGPGVAFALAPDVETARNMLLKNSGRVVILEQDLEKEPAVYTEPFAFAVYG